MYLKKNTKQTKIKTMDFIYFSQVRHQFGCKDDILLVDGKEVRQCNWVRFCKSSDKLELSNIFASSTTGKPTYQTLRTIKPNDEIVVYFNTSPQSEEHTTLENVGNPEESLLSEEEEEIDVVDIGPDDVTEAMENVKEREYLDLNSHPPKSELNSSSESSKILLQLLQLTLTKYTFRYFALISLINKHFIFFNSKKREAVIYVANTFVVSFDITYCKIRRLSIKC